MRRFTLPALAVLLGLLVGTAQGQAQDRTTSPHGDLTLECTVCHQSSSWSAIQVSDRFDGRARGDHLPVVPCIARFQAGQHQLCRLSYRQSPR
jgi:hypothetical protein